MVTLHTRIYDALSGGAYGQAKRFDPSLFRSIDTPKFYMKASASRTPFNALAGEVFGYAKRSLPRFKPDLDLLLKYLKLKQSTRDLETFDSLPPRANDFGFDLKKSLDNPEFTFSSSSNQDT